ncbi:hypothetical protein SEA_DARTHPHADER_69 [Mycobacterium phage DarthPhader]|uniref:Uncharacterized protein n=1 Tax=Mycobacterium phage DarthPhader TaxID=1912975 RepID=A0A1I9S415_9CAUD|nr:hypothetical protein KIV60_gp32 [Mycobacterium phage DarthPhader]AOZ61309.1 hypothetical protein SEA_DARTHPHADER_69 [Mycobacterium phage DarthPhader]
MKLPDPVLIESQGMVFRVSTVITMIWDIVVAPHLTPTRRK